MVQDAGALGRRPDPTADGSCWRLQGEVSVPVLTQDLATQWCDDMLRLIQMVSETKPRDPFRAMQDAVLELRTRVTCS